MGVVDQSAKTGKGRATRERVVVAAASLVHRRGVAGTNNAAIKRAAGVSSSQIYHYFSDKEDLARAVVDHQIERVVGAQSTALARVEDLSDLLAWRDVLVTAAQAERGAGGCPLGSLSAELTEAAPWARARLFDAFSQWQQAIDGALSRLAERGQISADVDVHRLAAALLAAVQGGLLLAQVTRTTNALEAGLDTALAELLGP